MFETLDGFTVTRDPDTGFYQYAALSNDGSELLPTGYQADRADPQSLGLARGIRANPNASTSEANLSELSITKPRWQTRRENARMEKLVELEADVAAPPLRPTVSDFVGLCLLIDFPEENLISNVSNPTVRSVMRKICFTAAVTCGSVMLLIQTVAGGMAHRPD